MMEKNRQHAPRLWSKWIVILAVFVGVGFYWVGESVAADILVYKSLTCECCKGWIKHIQENGFTVRVESVDDVAPIKRRLGVPEALESCHTAQVGPYLIEGHVPAADIKRLLTEKPDVLGIAAPGMPVGSPGMEVPGENPSRYDVIAFTKDGKSKVFATH